MLKGKAKKIIDEVRTSCVPGWRFRRYFDWEHWWGKNGGWKKINFYDPEYRFGKDQKKLNYYKINYNIMIIFYIYNN